MLVHPGATKFTQFFTMTISLCPILFGCLSCFTHFLPAVLSFDEDLVGVMGQPAREKS
jgi:hypothetical protein